MVRELIQESVHEEMVKELGLNEAAGGTLSSTPSIATVGSSSSTGTSGTKSGVGTTPGNDDPANSVMVPGTNMNLNAGLQAAAKETNFKKKADLINKISDQLTGMKGVVVKEVEEAIDEPDMPLTGGQKVSTRSPMFPDLINRITNLVYYGEKTDDEILADLGASVTSNPKMVRWVKFIADMVRKGKDAI